MRSGFPVLVPTPNLSPDIKGNRACNVASLRKHLLSKRASTLRGTPRDENQSLDHPMSSRFGERQTGGKLSQTAEKIEQHDQCRSLKKQENPQLIATLGSISLEKFINIQRGLWSRVSKYLRAAV